MATADLVCDALVIEVALLDEDYGGSGAPTVPIRRLLLRRVPDVCSLLASHVGQLSAEEDAVQVLDHIFSRPPFNDRRMHSWTQRLQAHLAAYARSLARWEGWHAHTIDLGEYREDVTVRWVTAWERPDDGAVAADFVGYVEDPKDLARPSRLFTVFARDAAIAYQRLEDEYGVPSFKGLRLWIVGADGWPVVRWQRTDTALWLFEDQD